MPNARAQRRPALAESSTQTAIVLFTKESRRPLQGFVRQKEQYRTLCCAQGREVSPRDSREAELSKHTVDSTY